MFIQPYSHIMHSDAGILFRVNNDAIQLNEDYWVEPNLILVDNDWLKVLSKIFF